MGNITDIMGYESPFGQESLFNKEEDWKKELERLLSNGDVSSFIYSNKATIDGIPIIIRIRGVMKNSKLETEIFITPDFIETSFSSQETPFEQLPKLKYLENSPYFLVVKKEEKEEWELYDKKIDNGFISEFVDDLAFGNRTLNDREFRQLYYEFLDIESRLNSTKEENLLGVFDEIIASVNKQVLNPFYSDVKTQVNIEQFYGQGDKQTFASASINNYDDNKENYDVQINISIDKQGRVSLKHNLHEDYLKEYTKKWVEEAQARGMEIDIESLRQQVINDFEAIQTQKNFKQRFLTALDKHLGISLGKYVEAVQATQKVTKHVWSKGTINESLWHSKNNEHVFWPDYMQFNTYVAGSADGVIDEIVGLPLACKSVYELATDNEKRKALRKAFTKEGFKQMVNGIGQEIEELRNDSEKREHFGGKTVIAVVTIMLGVGMFTKSRKADELLEVIETTSETTGKFSNPKTLELLSDAKQAKRTVADEKALKELVEEVGEEAIEDAADEIIDIAAKKGKKFTWEEIKVFFKRGNDFNKKAVDGEWYPENEIWLTHPTKVYPKGHKSPGKPRRFRLDSWDSAGDGKIVSRKATTLEDIKLSTFENYLKEIGEKYPEGAKIANPKIGDKLYGKKYLEIPESNQQFSKIEEYIKLAKEQYNVEVIFKPE